MFRTGSDEGDVTWPVLIGMWAGLVAPLTLTVLLIVGGAFANDQNFEVTTFVGAETTTFVEAEHATTSFSQIRDEMSDLGDRDDAVGTAFEVVQYVSAVLLLAFAYAFWKRVPSGRLIVLLLLIVVLATAALGKTRCQEAVGCAPISLSNESSDPYEPTGNAVIDHNEGLTAPQVAEKVDSQSSAHDYVAIVIASSIVLTLLAAASQLPSTGKYALLRRAGEIGLLIAIASAMALFAQAEDGAYRGLAERGIWIGGYGWIITASVLMLRHRKRRLSSAFDVTLLQENIVFGSRRFTTSRLIRANIRDAEGFRAWLQSALRDGLIRSEQPRPRPHARPDRRFAVMLAVSHKGLDALGVTNYRWNADDLDDPFAEGMSNRFDLLGDRRVGKFPSPWDEHHVLFWIVAENEAAMSKAQQALDMERCGPDGETPRLRCVVKQEPYEDASVRSAPLRIEPFGFVDGISNPWLKGVHDPNEMSRAGGGKVTDQGFQQIALGEFILGEVDESDDVLPVPDPALLFHHGTFMVVRKIAQDKRAFDEISNGLAKDTRFTCKHSAEDVASMLVGRRKDGTPLAATKSDYAESRNHFLFGDDPTGEQCPVGAHIRRANPRDSLGFGGVPTHRRRIIRRGMPYEETVADERTEGLMFVCMNARIADQFEFIQRFWLNDGDALRLGTTRDAVAGAWGENRRMHFVLPTDEGPHHHVQERQPVTTLAGGYFLLPSMAGLKFLSRS